MKQTILKNAFSFYSHLGLSHHNTATRQVIFISHAVLAACKTPQQVMRTGYTVSGEVKMLELSFSLSLLIHPLPAAK